MVPPTPPLPHTFLPFHCTLFRLCAILYVCGVCMRYVCGRCGGWSVVMSRCVVYVCDVDMCVCVYVVCVLWRGCGVWLCVCGLCELCAYGVWVYVQHTCFSIFIISLWPRVYFHAHLIDYETEIQPLVPHWWQWKVCQPCLCFEA